jgi:hypothetical protein
MEFVADSSGQLTAVLVPFEGFRRLMLDYRSIATAFKTKDEDFIDWEDALAELRADGTLPPAG